MVGCSENANAYRTDKLEMRTNVRQLLNTINSGNSEFDEHFSTGSLNSTINSIGSLTATDLNIGNFRSISPIDNGINPSSPTRFAPISSTDTRGTSSHNLVCQPSDAQHRYILPGHCVTYAQISQDPIIANNETLAETLAV